MSEKPESEEFEDEEADEPVTEDGDVDLDQVIKDLDLAKRRGQKVGDPAWRRLERSEEHTSELQSPCNLVCRLLLEKKQRTHCGIRVLIPPQQHSPRQLLSPRRRLRPPVRSRLGLLPRVLITESTDDVTDLAMSINH